MAGIYIHIPFCKTRCSYCDFFTATDTSLKNEYIDAVNKELVLRKIYLGGEAIQTIYFGGGTPSQLSVENFKSIFETIYREYEVKSDVEITIEANPDDLSHEYIDCLKQLPINRISIGIQSFNDDELKSINRRHSGEDARKAVIRCQRAGFDNISIDLMYGLPSQSLQSWSQTLDEASKLNVQHISSYHLIYEEGTKMYLMLEQGKIEQIDEDISLEMFAHMNRFFKDAGFVHYEISNFAKEGYHSKHNSSYWIGEKYLGIGASAHSFDGETRSWNIPSTQKYIDSINNGTPSMDVENLSIYTRYNDYIITRMRTTWGANLDEIENIFGKYLKEYCLSNIEKHIKNNDVKQVNNILKITEKGIFVSDGIMSDLMYIEENDEEEE